MLLNLNAFNDSLDNQDNDQGVDADTEEIYERYKEKAFRVLGRMGAQIAQVHQRAALSAQGSAGYWTKPYDEFRLAPK